MMENVQLALIWGPILLLIVATVCITIIIVSTRDNARLIAQKQLEYDHKLLMVEK